MAKILCQELQTLLEDKKDEIDIEENAYMELANKIVDVYNAIEENEYVGIYYNIITEQYSEDCFEPEISVGYAILKLTDEEEYHGHSTKDLRAVLYYRQRIHRSKVAQIKDTLESFDHHFQLTVPFYSGSSYANCGYTIFKVIEL